MMNPTRMSKSIYLLLSLVLLSNPLLAGCNADLFSGMRAAPTPTPTLVFVSSEIMVEGHLIPRDSVSLAFQSAGKISEVLVNQGDTVTKGTVLARLGDREQVAAVISAAQLEQLNAQQALDKLNEKADLARSQAHQALLVAQKAVIDAQQRLEDLDTDEYQTKLDDAWKDVVTAKEDLKTAQEDLDKYKNLGKDDPTRKRAEDDLEFAQKKYDDTLRKYDLLQNALDQAKANVDLAKSNQVDAQREYDARLNGPDPKDFTLAQAMLENAKAQLVAAQAVLNNLELVAPFDGTIVELDISQDEEVIPHQVVILLADLSQWFIETSDLTEMEVVKVDASRPVKVVPDALPDLELEAVVDKIPYSFKEKAGDIVYAVRLRLKDSDSRLRWGMTVKVSFEK